jgi:ribosomal protein L37E
VTPVTYTWSITPAICGIVSYSGAKGEPLACGFPAGHAGNHAWATLPTFTQVEHP